MEWNVGDWRNIRIKEDHLEFDEIQQVNSLSKGDGGLPIS